LQPQFSRNFEPALSWATLNDILVDVYLEPVAAKPFSLPSLSTLCFACKFQQTSAKVLFVGNLEPVYSLATLSQHIFAHPIFPLATMSLFVF
jgi:hypothetical protein